MILDCQLKSLLKNYLKTIIVGFGQSDVLGFSLSHFFLVTIQLEHILLIRLEIHTAIGIDTRGDHKSGGPESRISNCEIYSTSYMGSWLTL